MNAAGPAGRTPRRQAEAVAEPCAVGPWSASRLRAELREYRKRREDWERDVQRLMQTGRDLEAQHWQLVLHSIETTARFEAREARETLPAPAAGVEEPGFEESMRLFERSLLNTALGRANGCQRKAAALLGILPTTFCEKLKRLGATPLRHGSPFPPRVPGTPAASRRRAAQARQTS